MMIDDAVFSSNRPGEFGGPVMVSAPPGVVNIAGPPFGPSPAAEDSDFSRYLLN